MRYLATLRGRIVEFSEYSSGHATKEEAIKALFDWQVEQVQKREQELKWARHRLNRLISSAEYQRYFGRE